MGNFNVCIFQGQYTQRTLTSVGDNIVSVVDGWSQHDGPNASVKKLHDSDPLSISTAAVIASLQ
jgi:hypothetical protein